MSEILQKGQLLGFGIFLIFFVTTIGMPTPLKAKTALERVGDCRPVVSSYAGESKGIPDTFTVGLCFGYFYAHLEYYKSFPNDPIYPKVCLPSDVTVIQAILVFTNYSDNHPEEINKDDFIIINEAFKEAWPCE